jgi:phosphatidylserine/phosphatidylglycerophosphate/cardiolipin synthase-like enzyme
MVVDGRRVLVGTGNWTYGGFFLNDENYLVIDSPAVAQVFSENFNYFLEKYRG